MSTADENFKEQLSEILKDNPSMIDAYIKNDFEQTKTYTELIRFIANFYLISPKETQEGILEELPRNKELILKTCLMIQNQKE